MAKSVHVRYTPPVRKLFVTFPEFQRPEGHITNKLLNIARCISENIYQSVVGGTDIRVWISICSKYLNCYIHGCVSLKCYHVIEIQCL